VSTEVASYLMNPAEDVILFGTDLAEGMWVLPESAAGRMLSGRPEEVRLRAQRFRRVTRLRVMQGDRYQGGTGTIFVGEWVDGYQEVHEYTAENAWLVKRDSLPVDGKPAEVSP
jgi:hypothetical protein